MIKEISSWAEQVIIAVIIGTLIEVILPKGNSKKYIKTIIGIYILYVILAPFIKFAVGDFKINYSDVEKYFNTSSSLSNIQAYSMEDTYEKELEKKLKSDIENMEYNVKTAEIKLNLEDGNIEKIILVLSKDNIKDTDISVNKVQIGEREVKEEDDEESKILKEKISEDYGANLEDIYISWK